MHRYAELLDPAGAAPIYLRDSPLAVAWSRGIRPSRRLPRRWRWRKHSCKHVMPSSVPQLHERSLLRPDLVARISIGRLHRAACCHSAIRVAMHELYVEESSELT